MSIAILALAGVAILGVGILVAIVLARARGTRLVTCPENGCTAAVEVKIVRAAITGLAGTPELRLRDCSRWPEKEGCAQECLGQIAAAPEGCLVRRILDDYFSDKVCAICGKALLPIDWMGRAPALLGPDGKTLETREIVPEKIPEILRSHRAVCFDCHIASTFRREFAHLVVDRPGPKPPEGRPRERA